MITVVDGLGLGFNLSLTGEEKLRKRDGRGTEGHMERLDCVLAFHCAPVLMGKKAANLLIVAKELAPSVNKAVKNLAWNPYKVSSVFFFCDGVKSIFFLYNRRQLEVYLDRMENRLFLQGRGYRLESLEDDIGELKKRFCTCRRAGLDFPHEMGLFLGYPLWDVKGFIDHQGRECLYTGYWKVYDRLPRARRIFLEYNRCRQVMTRRAGIG